MEYNSCFLVQAVNVASAGFIAAHTAVIYELQYSVTKGLVQESFSENDVKIKIHVYPCLSEKWVYTSYFKGSYQ